MSLKGEARLRIKNCRIELLQSLLGLKELKFAEITLNADIERGKLAITGADFKGREMSGSLSGVIGIAVPASESVLELKGFIEPHASLFSEPTTSSEARAGIMQFARKGRINFLLQGKLKNPQFKII